MRAPSGQLSTLYYDQQGLLYAMQEGSQRYYIGTDHLGTPHVVADSTGAIVETLSYDSFGNITADSNPSFGLPIGFAGGLTDPVTGLLRFGLRDYDPVSGRWTARDPSLYSSGQTSLYSYVGSDPVGHRDPTGLFTIGISGYAGIGGGAELGITGSGISVCAEVGVGVGESLTVNPYGDLATDFAGLAAEVQAGIGGIATATGGVQYNALDPCEKSKGTEQVCTIVTGCTELVDTSEEGLKAESKGVQSNFSKDGLEGIGKEDLEAKAVAKACQSVRW